MRLLIPFTLLALLVVAACGGDDEGNGGTQTPTSEASSSPSPSSTPSRSAASDTATASPTPVPTPIPTPSPTRRNVAYDHYGVNTGDVVELFGGIVPTALPCPYVTADVVLDCTSQGLGRIAVDITPRGEVTECFALLGPEDELFAASCATNEPTTWYYKIIE